MTKYDVVYIDDMGDKQDFVVDAKSLKEAISGLKYFCPDCKRVVSCTPKPMFED